MILLIDVTADAYEDDVEAFAEHLATDTALKQSLGWTPQAPETGTLNGAADLLTFTLGPGGAVASFVTLTMAWLRYRKAAFTMKFTRSDGAVLEVTADTVRTQTGEQLSAILQDFVSPTGRASSDATGTAENVE